MQKKDEGGKLSSWESSVFSPQLAVRKLLIFQTEKYESILRLLTVNCELKIANCKLPTANCGLKTVD